MTLTDLESEVLGHLLDDLEAPQSLAQNVSEALARPVTQVEILAAMVRLAAAGFAQGYEYDTVSASYRVVEPDRLAARDEVWFKATVAGRKFIDDVA